MSVAGDLNESDDDGFERDITSQSGFCDSFLTQDASKNNLSYEKMCYVRNKSHPRDKPDYNYTSVCCSTTGCLCCRKEYRESDFRQYGGGIVLYF